MATTNTGGHSTAASGRPAAIGAYIFAGGFTLGIKQHFNVLCHLEGDKYGVATMRRNQPEIPVYYGPENWPLDTFGKSEIDLIYGNPPCAAWSMAGRRGDSWLTDPRVDCTRKHFSLLEELRPRRAWVWESVARAFTSGRPFVDHLTERALALGYHVTYLLHDARWLGLPQRRSRFFFIAHRGNPPDVPRLNWAPPRTVGETLRELPGNQVPATTAENKYIWLVKEAEEGAQLYHVFDRLRPGERGPGSGRPGYLARRLLWDAPAFTFAGGAWFHPRKNRQLSLEEYKALNGFPLDYEFTPRGDQAKLSEMARGVTPVVGEWLGRFLINSIGTHEPLMPAVTTIDLRTPQ